MALTFEKRGAELGRLVDAKQAQYGNSVERAARILEVLYPNGVKPDRYGDMLLMVRILDKLSRIATRGPGDGESPFIDIAGYGLLGARKDEVK